MDTDVYKKNTKYKDVELIFFIVRLLHFVKKVTFCYKVCC